MPTTVANTPSVTVAMVLDATEKWTTREEFTAFLGTHGYCYDQTVREATFTYSTHFPCGSKSIGKDGLQVNFARSDDGNLNSSFTTRNPAFASSFREELTSYAFKKVRSDPARAGADWYSSRRYSRVEVMWEELKTADGSVIWHVGFVWKPRVSPSGG